VVEDERVELQAAASSADVRQTLRIHLRPTPASARVRKE
jgi:hypothetical protein